MKIVTYEPRHLDQILAMCKTEGWVSFGGNRDRAARAMSNPGVTALVAVESGGAEDEGKEVGEAIRTAGRADREVGGPREPVGGRREPVGDDEGSAQRERVLGFAQAVGDGAFGGYLCMLLVAEDARGRGIGKALVERTLVESGVLRLDLLSSDEAMSLYERFPHHRIPGFRLYPDESLRPPKSTPPTDPRST